MIIFYWDDQGQIQFQIADFKLSTDNIYLKDLGNQENPLPKQPIVSVVYGSKAFTTQAIALYKKGINEFLPSNAVWGNPSK